MVEIFKPFRQYAIEVLSALKGEMLQISANLTSPDQIDYLLESHAHEVLGAQFIIEETEMYLRMTKSYGAKYSTYVSEIAKTPEFKGGDMIAAKNDL